MEATYKVIFADRTYVIVYAATPEDAKRIVLRRYGYRHQTIDRVRRV